MSADLGLQILQFNFGHLFLGHHLQQIFHLSYLLVLQIIDILKIVNSLIGMKGDNENLLQLKDGGLIELYVLLLLELVCILGSNVTLLEAAAAV